MFVGRNYCFKPYTCQMNKIYRFLGREVYIMLEDMELPEGHLTLNTCLLMISSGCSLPTGHMDLKEILKKALEETETEEKIVESEIDVYASKDEG